MREIKFRGRLKAKCYKGKWVEGCYVSGARNAFGSLIDYGIVKTGYFPEEIDGSTLGQFTGLQDKNGKGIFGGDKLYIDDVYLGYIRWNDGAFHIFDVSTNCLSNPLVQERAKRLEIRGNIHDNPEILP